MTCMQPSLRHKEEIMNRTKRWQASRRACWWSTPSSPPLTNQAAPDVKPGSTRRQTRQHQTTNQAAPDNKPGITRQQTRQHQTSNQAASDDKPVDRSIDARLGLLEKPTYLLTPFTNLCSLVVFVKMGEKCP